MTEKQPESRPVQRVEAEVSVLMRPGITIEAWLRMHAEKKMNRVVVLRGKQESGAYMCTVTYEARGADLADIMRPYRETMEWARLASVVKIGTTRTVKIRD